MQIKRGSYRCAIIIGNLVFKVPRIFRFKMAFKAVARSYAKKTTERIYFLLRNMKHAWNCFWA
ncbi:MAG: hypothetical protein NTZ97_00130, partial [Candidatus Moranbacteria bacterium]|nr:hypothetical protein [Candidatus Moranbacteria bacterium]